MKRHIIAFLLILLMALVCSLESWGGGPCGDYEYAELQDMNQQTLEKELCNITIISYQVLMQSLMERRSTLTSQSCINLQAKMERVYMKKFNMTEQEMKDRLRGCTNKK